jgi:hypothetical protein
MVFWWLPDPLAVMNAHLKTLGEVAMNLLRKLLPSVVASVGLLAAGYAAATPTPLSTSSTQPTVQWVSGDSFDDLYSFSLSSLADVTIAGTSSDVSFELPWGTYTMPAVDFTGFKLSSALGSVTSTDVEAEFGQGSFSVTWSDLAAGDYTFKLKGTVGGGSTLGGISGVYALAVAVPEPGDISTNNDYQV